ncbi:ImmA/IrrE family metallo-endopeptidase [Polyangium mundeleinium]|uniref:ImmA/IrrE family metallo-endopeptidase n=1 Tax=Polyangium mundeleinium TaxID=2995306 RepID=A0ABT5EJ30_9BACT|nr:ImmA/IrrE family metallo-endopeptidase [Polyangium mundeleinium]MDC0740952.1 ImmA/IrrE family metallo-endopeptidase [Polyangium mundeleinium]
MGPELADLKAEEVLRERCIASLPIDPMAIARDIGIDVVEKPTGGGVSGMLIRSGDAFAIAYAAHVPSEGFQRFSVAHELGHYFLSGHIDHVLRERSFHESRAGYVSRDRYEAEADKFAAGLLMPRSLFVRELAAAGEGLEAIEDLARKCKTSLTATAIRFAEYVDEPVAIVVSNPNDESIQYCFMSKRFQEFNVTWLRKGELVPRGTLTARFNGDPGQVLHAERDEDTVELRTWFATGPDLRLVEQVIGLGTYGKSLTVLTFEEVFDEEEVEREESLIDSWTPTFSRSRRR